MDSRSLAFIKKFSTKPNSSNEFVIEFSGAEKKSYGGSFEPTPAGPTRVRL